MTMFSSKFLLSELQQQQHKSNQSSRLLYHTHTRLTAIFLGFTVFTMCCVLVVWTGAAGRAGEASDLHLARSLFMSLLCELHCTILQMHCVCVCVCACVRACVRARARACVGVWFCLLELVTHTHNCLMAFFRDGTTLGWPVPERLNQSGFYWSKRQWVAVASAGPYASLHLAPHRQPHQHPTTQFFLQAACPSCHPTNSVKALKAVVVRTGYLKY